MNRAIIVLPFLLAACSSEPTVRAENASVAEVKAKIEAAGDGAIQLSPGRWESSVTMDRIDIPGMPPQLAERMKTAMANKTSARCLTPEEAKKPAAEFFAGRDRGGCKYDHFEMGNGNLDAKMVCGAQGGTAEIAMKGAYDPDSFHLAMSMNGQNVPNAPQGKMSMAMTVDSKRTGECTGQEK